jgi:predicted nucleotidyltransferase
LKQLPVQRIILIGSMATDTSTAFSDIDLIVIMETGDRFLDRLKVAYEKIQPAVAMDILVYTPEEFEEMSRSRPFLFHALKESKVLYAA